jgi:hypothetical protein
MEVKGNLARLLATENLIVEHRKVNTAMFNVKDRVLTLPMWDVASPNVYDMLVGHEVGHALYTPDKWGADYGVPQSYLNVCEDARIEKMMKRKFPGLARNFYTGYKELHDADFFEVGDRPINSYQLIDRINLYFKIGVHVGEVFTWKPEEKVLIDMLEVAETFDDVVEVARKILQYTQEQQKIEVEMDTTNTTQSGSDSTPDGGDNQGESEQSQQVSDQPNDSDDGNQSFVGQTGGVEKLESETDKAFINKQKQLSSNPWSNDINYVELPPLNIDTFVITNKQVMKDCRECYDEQESSLFIETDSAYVKFRAEAQREVNYLVKEFEMRKSADQYARASTAKTGILDTQKLYTYKWNEDVFKKINIVPDGKNHGLIFMLDWSSSMRNCLMDTVKQLMNLAWFCKKVQIPFDIYAFTNKYWASDSHYSTDTCTKSIKHHKEIPGYVSIYEHFRLLNVVSSNGRNGKDLETQLKNFWRLANVEAGYRFYYNPPGYSLDGTPLHEAAISLTAVIPDFQKRNKVQKTNVVILTDGESQSINYIVKLDVKNCYNNNRIGYNYIDRDCVLRDRKTGCVYPRFDSGYHGCSDKITKVFLQNVHDRFPDVNLIGIRLINGRQLNKIYNSDICKISYIDIQKQWQKIKTAELVDFLGYQSLYLIALDSLSATTEFDVEEDATNKEIGTAFKKALANKGVNKKMLTSFAALIS